MSDLSTNLEALFGKLEDFVTTKTVVGEPLNLGGIILLPLVDVNFGVGAGVRGNSKEKDNEEWGAGGLGAKITPTAVLVINNGAVQLVSCKNQDSLSKLIDLAPGAISKLNLGSLFKSDKVSSASTSEAVTDK